MKILLVVTGLPDTNYPARSVFNLRFAEELIKYNIDVSILYIRAFKPNRGLVHISQRGRLKIITVNVLIPKTPLTPNVFPLVSIFNLLLERKSIREELKNADLIHAVHRGSVELAYKTSLRFNIPMISQFIGGDLTKDLPFLRNRKLFMSGIRHSSVLCFNSKKLEKEFVNHFKEDFLTKVLYRGVKLKDFPYSFHSPSVIKVLFLGGFPGHSNSKGGVTLLEAIKILDDKNLLNDIQFIIGGPNSKAFQPKMNGLKNNKIKVEIIGAIDKLKVKDYMTESHIVVIPSQAEGIPNVLYEAMASGNLVIASDVGGISEILDNGESGALIPANSAEELAKALHNFIVNPESIEQHAQRGRAKIEKLDYSLFIEGYLKLYEQSLFTPYKKNHE